MVEVEQRAISEISPMETSWNLRDANAWEAASSTRWRECTFLSDMLSGHLCELRIRRPTRRAEIDASGAPSPAEAAPGAASDAPAADPEPQDRWRKNTASSAAASDP